MLIGRFVPAVLEAARAFATGVLDPFGQVFLRLLFFVVIPLIFCSLAAGVVQLGKLSALGPLAGRTFALFFLNMSIALALGLVMMNLLDLGGQLDTATKERLMTEYGGAAAAHVER